MDLLREWRLFGDDLLYANGNTEDNRGYLPGERSYKGSVGEVHKRSDNYPVDLKTLRKIATPTLDLFYLTGQDERGQNH